MYNIIYLISLLVVVGAEYKYETKWFTVPLDHFGFQRNETFQIKYLVNESYWDQGSGPIFFYTGNEGQIEVFAKHTGFIWEIAPLFKAKIVFAEHRYYGASMPFGNKSMDNDHIGYLSSAQALADYADLINYLQGNNIKPRYPVIAFGGSYGGMLAAYFRMKYPHIVSGAIAASAPVHMYPGMTSCDIFNRLVTSNFRTANENCSINIRESWSVIRSYAANANGSEWLHKNWNLCSPLKTADDLDVLLDFLSSMYSTLAMVNYPFSSDFLMPLPAEPVRVVCQYLDKKMTGEQLLQGIGKVLDVFTNYDKSSKCVDYKEGDNYGNLDASGWDYQACTEMVMPMCTNGKTDMFEPMPWNYTKFAEGCHKKYNVYPRGEMARLEYGGNRLQAASNIVFSNGLRDPWTGGGILDSLSDTVRAVVIIDAAHHLDLMPSNPSDPEPVKMAREFHKQHITRWINQFREQYFSTRKF
ncbi:lysosomal Pro-X carboxypeptidase [Anticarsia gemmatalis]|uniref:lysosomal Pro-X carboxypeptidase n=1 Tax=Anticarsia gemmatalis TaxID=129554 RepID=UPI003F7631E3